MSSNPQIPITVGGAEYVEPLASLLAAAFVNDPINRYIILSTDDIPNDAVITQERRVEGFLPRLRARAEAGPHFVEAGNWAAAALWFPPSTKLPPPDRNTAPEMVIEYSDKFSEVKKRHLGDQNYWYLNLLGRHPERTEPGMIRAIMETYLQKAQEEGVPAWLEASNEHARDVYIHLGFRLVEEIHLAVGKADKDGYRVTGGDGITVYAMIVEPKP